MAARLQGLLRHTRVSPRSARASLVDGRTLNVSAEIEADVESASFALCGARGVRIAVPASIRTDLAGRRHAHATVLIHLGEAPSPGFRPYARLAAGRWRVELNTSSRGRVRSESLRRQGSLGSPPRDDHARIHIADGAALALVVDAPSIMAVLRTVDIGFADMRVGGELVGDWPSDTVVSRFVDRRDRAVVDGALWRDGSRFSVQVPLQAMADVEGERVWDCVVVGDGVTEPLRRSGSSEPLSTPMRLVSPQECSIVRARGFTTSRGEFRVSTLLMPKDG